MLVCLHPCAADALPDAEAVLSLSQDNTSAILRACFPHVLPVMVWTYGVQAKVQLGLPTITFITALRAAARCVCI